MQPVEIPIADIIVKGRFRQEMGDVDALADSIQAIGLIQPITIDDRMHLLAGERRLLAHKQLGKTSISALVRPYKDMVDALEVELAENLARKDMTWQEVSRLEKRIYDEKLKAGHWTNREQAKMLNESKTTTNRNIKMAEAMEMIPELANHASFDDAWKEYKKIEENFVAEILQKKVPDNVRQASKWADDHYHVGDAFVGMRKVRDELAHFAEVDPPYGVDLDRRKSRNKTSASMQEYNEVDADEYIPFYAKIASEVFRILKPDSFAVFWYGWDWHEEVRQTLLGAGFKVPTVPAIWTKGNSGQTASPDTTFGSCHEPFFLARKGMPKLAKPGRGNVFDYKPVPTSHKVHATERPLELMEEILNTCLFPGSTIIVPFLGSGATLRAAYKTGHIGFGWDLSEEHKKGFLKNVAKDIGETEDEPE